jgi:hypothetical protein
METQDLPIELSMLQKELDEVDIDIGPRSPGRSDFEKKRPPVAYRIDPAVADKQVRVDHNRVIHRQGARTVEAKFDPCIAGGDLQEPLATCKNGHQSRRTEALVGMALQWMKTARLPVRTLANQGRRIQI